MGSGLNQRGRATCGFGLFRSHHRKPGKKIDVRGRHNATRNEIPLVLTPRPDAPILAGIAPPLTRDRDPRQWHFARRLRVVAVGAWGTVPQSTVDDLTALDLSLDQTVATLGKVDGILSAANYGIYRQRRQARHDLKRNQPVFC